MKEFSKPNFVLGKSKTNIFVKIFNLILIIFLCVFTTMYMFYLFCFQVKVYGSSMYPTFSDKNNEVAVALRWFGLYHGDTVVILHKDTMILKRVIAMGDDELSLVQDKDSELCVYYLNGNPLNEYYIKSAGEMNDRYYKKVKKLKDVVETETATSNILTILIPSDCVFVLGDNRGVSEDSSSLGPLQRSQIIGKVFFKYKIA